MKKLLFLFFTFSLFITHYCGAQGTWTQKATLPDIGRSFGISFSIGNYGYIGLGGDGNSTFYNDLWQYDPSNNAWMSLANFPGKARGVPEWFVIGNNVYVVMGIDTTYTCVSECWMYNVMTNSWTQKNDFPGPLRAYGIGFSIGNKGFIGTGCYEYMSNQYAYYKDFWEYDTGSDSWTRKADFGGIARRYSSGFAIGNKGYLCFGQDSLFYPYGDIWEYDTTSNSWTQKNNYPGTSVYSASGFVIGNRIYIGTGFNGYFYKAFAEYNTVDGIWSMVSSFPGIARSCAFSFAINRNGYLGLGIDSLSISNNDFYEYVPDTLTGINEVSAEEGVSIFPNPSNGIFTISLSQPELVSGSQATVEIYNALGKKVYGGMLNSRVNGQHNYEIDISNQPTGIYILQINSQNQIFYSKLIVNN